jgi:hypothetical protein
MLAIPITVSSAPRQHALKRRVATCSLLLVCRTDTSLSPLKFTAHTSQPQPYTPITKDNIPQSQAHLENCHSLLLTPSHTPLRRPALCSQPAANVEEEGEMTLRRVQMAHPTKIFSPLHLHVLIPAPSPPRKRVPAALLYACCSFVGT